MPDAEALSPDAQYTVFHPSEVELTSTTQAIFETVERVKPVRVVFDSLSELRLLARDSLRYRRQILGFKHFFSHHRSTVILLDDRTGEDSDQQLRSLAHGVLLLEQLALDYGAERRKLRVVKMRGVLYRGGYHDYTIRTGGLVVFPRLIAAEHHTPFERSTVLSGVGELDTLLGGGLDSGTSSLIMGPAGCGKTVLATQYACAAASRGDHVAFYLFDERLGTFSDRADRLGMPIEKYQREGKIFIRSIDPAEVSPGEFAHTIVDTTTREGSKFVVIDSSERIHQCHAGRAAARHSPARAAELPGAARCHHPADPGAARAIRLVEQPGGGELPGRQPAGASILRGCGRGPEGHLGAEEAKWAARADHP